MMHKCCYVYCIIAQDSCWYPSGTHTHSLYTELISLLSNSHSLILFRKDQKTGLFIYVSHQNASVWILTTPRCAVSLSLFSIIQATEMSDMLFLFGWKHHIWWVEMLWTARGNETALSTECVCVCVPLGYQQLSCAMIQYT